VNPADPNFVNVQAQNIIANIARGLGRHVIAPHTDHTSWVALSVIDWDTGWTVEIEWGDHLGGGCMAKLKHATIGTRFIPRCSLDDLEFIVRQPDVAAEAVRMVREAIEREGGAA
jgi:hypothetical protein